MLTTIRLTRFTLCSGQTGTFMMIVEQLGLAMMPVVLRDRSGFTSGTTSGMPSFMRKARVVDHDRARPRGGRGELLADRPAGREEGDLDVLERLGQFLDRVRLALELDLLAGRRWASSFRF